MRGGRGRGGRRLSEELTCQSLSPIRHIPVWCAVASGKPHASQSTCTHAAHCLAAKRICFVFCPSFLPPDRPVALPAINSLVIRRRVIYIASQHRSSSLGSLFPNPVLFQALYMSRMTEQGKEEPSDDSPPPAYTHPPHCIEQEGR